MYNLLKIRFMTTIFSKIIQGEIPSHKIAEDENYYAFLDIFPVLFLTLSFLFFVSLAQCNPFFFYNEMNLVFHP